MTLEELAPKAARIVWVAILGSAIVGALAASEVVRAFTRHHAPRNGEPPR